MEGDIPRGGSGIEFPHDVRHVLVEESCGGLRGMETWMTDNLNKEVDIIRETRDLQRIKGKDKDESYLEIAESAF